MTPAERNRLRRISSRLMRAVRVERPAKLRAAVVELAADIEAMLDGRTVPDEACPPTVRSEERDTEPAPPPASEPHVSVEWTESAD